MVIEREWTLEECTAVIKHLAKRHGVPAIQVKTNNRMSCGTFKLKLHRGKIDEQSGQIFLADHLWSGEYRNKGRRYTAYIASSALRRLMVVLHECAHMICWATHKESYQTIPRHGLLFKDIQTKLCREYGYRPIYKDVTSAKIDTFVDMNTGEAHDVSFSYRIQRWEKL